MALTSSDPNSLPAAGASAPFTRIATPEPATKMTSDAPLCLGLREHCLKPPATNPLVCRPL